MVKKGYKQTEIGVIPEHWKVSSLAAAFQRLEAGVSVNSDDSLSSEYYILKTSAVHDGVVDTAETKPVIPRDYPRLKCHLVKGSIIISRMNTPALVGECGFAKDAKAGTYLPDRLWQIQNLNKSSFDFVWLNYLLNTKQYRDAVRATATGTSNSMKNISKERLLDIKIPHPTISEQEDIAVVLVEVDELINLVEKQIDKKKAIKQGAMQELLTGKRRLPGFEGSWKTKKLGEYCTLVTKQTGFDYSAFIKPALITQKMPNTLPMIQTINFRGRKFAFDTDYYIPKAVALQFPNIVLNEKCVLFSIVGASVGNVGLYPGGTTAFCGGAIGITRFHNEQDAEWVYNYMISPDGQAQIQYVTKGGAQATVTIADIRNFKIPTPEKNERDAISSVLENMDHEIEVLEEKLAKYRQVKQGMMQQLLTGKIRLTKDIEDSMQAEQVISEKAMPLRPVHNHQFDDAVAIAAIVDAFYSDKYPLGRVKVQKLLYLLHRHQGVSVSDFKKKAAGPYADTVRYKGGEPIAKKNKYIVSESGKQGTRYSKGENMGQALDYVERWGMQADMQWLKENFLYTSRDDLELFATVDMAMCDLNEADIPVSVEAIKNLIASDKEWKAKLAKAFFSDRDIARAIRKCTELFS